VRKRAGIRSDSKLRILCADADMYVAAVGERLVIKMGPRYDMGALLPKKEQGWEKAASGKDYAVWVKGE
jgi:alpha-amylase